MVQLIGPIENCQPVKSFFYIFSAYIKTTGFKRVNFFLRVGMMLDSTGPTKYLHLTLMHWLTQALLYRTTMWVLSALLLVVLSWLENTPFIQVSQFISVLFILALQRSRVDKRSNHNVGTVPRVDNHSWSFSIVCQQLGAVNELLLTEDMSLR